MGLRVAVIVVAASALGACSLLIDVDGLADPAPLAAQSTVDGGSATAADADAFADAGGNPDAFATIDGSTVTAQYVQAVLADGPSLYYRLEETAAGPVKDEIGKYPGVYLAGTQYGAAGAFPGSAGIRVADTGGIRVDAPLDFDENDPFTLEAWVLPDVYDNAYRFLFLHEGNAALRQNYGIYLHAGDGLTLERYVDNDNFAAILEPPPPAGSWHHVVGTYDGQRLRLYVDAVEVDAETDTRAAKAKSTPLYIGAAAAGFSALEGTLDEIAIYEHALDSSRIQAHFAAAR